MTSSVNVTKSVGNYGFGHTVQIVNGEHQFFLQCRNLSLDLMKLSFDTLGQI